MKKDALIIVRGGGDLATGTIHRLCSAGLRVLVLETTQPAAIRRQVALCEAVYEGEATVEGLRAVRIEALEQAQSVWAQGGVPVLVDPEGICIARAKPEVVVDAILAKRNLGTRRDMAPLTIALGPGFVAGQDVDAVVEATAIAHEKAPDLLLEGPIQYDAAVDEAVAKVKLPDSPVAGRATVFVFPNLNAGNIGYKAVQRSSGAVAVGPVLQGLNKPVNDLSRGCTVPDIVNTVAITAVQAAAEKAAQK